MDDVLVPYAEAFDVIVNCDYKSDSHAAKINDLLRWLSRLDNSDWVPPAILWVSRHSSDEASVLLVPIGTRAARSVYAHKAGRYKWSHRAVWPALSRNRGGCGRVLGYVSTGAERR